MALQEYIQSKLNESFTPSYLSVVNESDGHNVAPGSETHFKVVLVADQFDSMNKVKRHQAVYRCLQDALANGVHALAIHTYSPAEWQAKGHAPESPNCLGGGKS